MARILVIDDSPLVRAILGDLLRDLGHEPVMAATAEEAVAMCTHSEFDLVIKDLILGDSDPNELMEELKEIDADLPIVVCSTIARRQEIFDALRSGAIDFLVKPISRDDLDRAIRRYALRR